MPVKFMKDPRTGETPNTEDIVSGILLSYVG